MKHQDSTTPNAEPEDPPMSNPADPVLPGEPKKRLHTYHGNSWSALGLSTHLSLVVSGCIIGSIMGGIYLDRLVGSNGLFVFLMIPVGLGCAAFTAWQIIKRELP